MSFAQKATKFLNENYVLITGVTIIIGVHWGWSKLQQTSLVPKEQRRDLPIIIAAKYAEKRVSEEIGLLTGSVSTEDKKM